MAEKFWNEIPNHFPFVKLDEIIVMPNHIHGIIIINKQNLEPTKVVETQDFASLQLQIQSNKFGPQSKNIASIIRGYKIGVTKNVRKIINNFTWQPRFHDHVIRDDDELNQIREYIISNPQNWIKDDNYMS